MKTFEHCAVIEQDARLNAKSTTNDKCNQSNAFHIILRLKGAYRNVEPLPHIT
jgi:hypothetical protein